MTGSLQVFRAGAFGTVCAAGFRDKDAQVACRQLGFLGGGFLPFALSAFSDEELEVLLRLLSLAYLARTCLHVRPLAPCECIRPSIIAGHWMHHE